MPTLNVPGDSILNALGGFFIVLGVILVLGGLGLAKLEKFTAVQGKKTWIAGVILVVLGVLFLFLETIESNKFSEISASTSGVPLQTAHIYDFEDLQDVTFIEPWELPPATQPHNLIISNQQEFSHSGTSALRMAVDLVPYTAGAAGGSWAEIRNLEEFDNVKAITAWVLLPRSEQLRDNKCSAYMFANVYTGDGETIAIYSATKELEPGKWALFFLGTFDFTAFYAPLDTTVEVKDRVNLTSLKVWCENSYAGSIYYDDIAIYTYLD